MIHITVFWFGPTVFKVWLALISYQLSAVAIRVNVLPCLHDAEAAASHMSFKSPAGAQTPSCAVGKKIIFSLSLTESSPFCLIWEEIGRADLSSCVLTAPRHQTHEQLAVCDANHPLLGAVTRIPLYTFLKHTHLQGCTNSPTDIRTLGC